VDQAVAALARLDRLYRPSIRSRFEERFSVRAMVRDYLKIYRKLSASDTAAVAAE
jgi:glycosyltransferase involved in cell wall biosynthesis